MAENKILVLGSTGNTGYRVAKGLLEKKASVVIGVRHSTQEKALALQKLGAEVREFDFEKKATFATAFAGIDSLFLLPPFVEHLSTIVQEAIDAAKAAGVKFIVKLSAIGADAKSSQHVVKQHGETDAYLIASGVHYAILQPTFFASNYLWQAATIKEQGAFYGSSGEGKHTVIHPDDIADAAIHVLLRPESYQDKIYILTGSEVLSSSEIAQIIGSVIGKEVKAVDLAPEAHKQTLLKDGTPVWQADDVVYVEQVKKNNWATTISEDVKNITGTAARTFKSWVEENVSAFKAAIEEKKREIKEIAFIPGTGNMGARLARLYVKAGYPVYVASRDIKKAEAEVAKLKSEFPSAVAYATTSAEAAQKAEIIFWGIQGSLEERKAALGAIRSELKGKIVIDVTNIAYLPEFKDEAQWGQVSSLEINQSVVPEARWVTGFKLIYAHALLEPVTNGIPRDVQVSGDDEAAKAYVISLINETGFRGIDAGSAKQARIWEVSLFLFGPLQKTMPSGTYGSLRYF